MQLTSEPTTETTQSGGEVSSLDEPGPGYVRLLNLLAVSQIALFLTTKLWWPPFDFPTVPLFETCRHWPIAVDFAAFFGSLAGTFFAKTAADKRSRRIRHAICAASLALLFALNQHRLQPWAYQFFVLHLWLALADHRDKLAGWRWLVISIYLFSAVSKIDYAFCTQHGPFLWNGLLQAIGFDQGVSHWPANSRFLAAAMLPAAELGVAGCLAVRRTQRIGLALSLLMHAGLLLALGPWGHNHSAGVLLWNVFFMTQNILLFPGRLRPKGSGTQSALLSPLPWRERGRGEGDVADRNLVEEQRVAAVSSPSSGLTATFSLQGRRDKTKCGEPLWRAFAAWWVLLFVLIAPVGEPFGLWDHWPSWSVYSARPERTLVSIHEDDAQRLPETLQTYLQPPKPLQPWWSLRLDRWSLDSARAPIYPQSRFQLGVAIAVAEQYQLTTLQVVIESPPDRWTGRRTSRSFTGLDEVRSQAASYRLNALPR